ncbi:DUF4833 domain-containing protein [Spirosoma fluminis]
MNLKSVIFLAVLTGFFVQGHSPAQAREPAFPTPPGSQQRLFYIQRSKDANTIVYDANLTTDGRLNARKPVTVYWIRYADKGQREDLTLFQWQMAYGYKHRQSAAEGYDICLNAFRKRPINVVYSQGKPMAFTSINGRSAHLQKVFVQVDPESGVIPRVQFIDMYGIDPQRGTPVHERITL